MNALAIAGIGIAAYLLLQGAKKKRDRKRRNPGAAWHEMKEREYLAELGRWRRGSKYWHRSDAAMLAHGFSAFESRKRKLP